MLYFFDSEQGLVNRQGKVVQELSIYDLASGIYNSIYLQLTWDAMERQTFLSPYIATGILSSDCMVLADTSSLLRGEITINCVAEEYTISQSRVTPNKNWYQYKHFIAVLRKDSIEVCTELIKIMEEE